jgi:hypothetical protein
MSSQNTHHLVSPPFPQCGTGEGLNNTIKDWLGSHPKYPLRSACAVRSAHQRCSHVIPSVPSKTLGWRLPPETQVTQLEMSELDFQQKADIKATIFLL